MKHLLSAKDLSHDEAVMVLDTAEAMAATQLHQVRKLPTLRGKTVVNLFFEDSTRTRLSFEAAAKRLSADVINFSAKGSSVSKGESLKDTAETLQAMGADAVVVVCDASCLERNLNLALQAMEITDNVVLCVKGELGVRVTALNLGGYAEAKRLISDLNRSLSIGEGAERAMLVGCLFGWDGVDSLEPAAHQRPVGVTVH